MKKTYVTAIAAAVEKDICNGDRGGGRNGCGLRDAVLRMRGFSS